nr:hypothetical protein [Tanacetum cinerariifolium]
MGKGKLSDYDDNESDDDICVNSRPSKISCFEKGCYSAENGGDYVNVKKESCGSCEEKGGNVARDEIVDEECCYEKSCNVNGELGENKGRYWDTWSERWTNDKEIYD